MSTMVSLVEKYRPQMLADLVGQDEVVAALKQFVAAPYETAFLFSGGTGTGKTSAALALAKELGVRVDAQELGGLHQLASGEQTADSVRRVIGMLWYAPMYGSGWKVLIVNEADRTSPQAETIWLDVLESLPPRCVVVFTTNKPEAMTDRLRDRCEQFDFRSRFADLKPAVKSLAMRVWQAETGKAQAPNILLHRILSGDADSGHVSFRRLVQEIGRLVRLEQGSMFAGQGVANA